MLAVAVVILSGQLLPVHAGEKSAKSDGRKSRKQHGETNGRKSVDQQLREFLTEQGVGPLAPGPAQDKKLVKLGQALFFDWELSGNRDIACATCHHPFLSTGDGLSLPIGTAAVTPGALGPLREIGPGREFVPRNAPEIFNRGATAWASQFWDSRVAWTGTEFISPAGTALPFGLPNVLAVQAVFPVTSRDEMRGRDGDLEIFGDPNEIAVLADDDLQGMWDLLMARLLAIPGYQKLFDKAFPGVTPGVEHAATAVAAFEADAYTFLDSPFDK